jgi:hypothetical protein
MTKAEENWRQLQNEQRLAVEMGVAERGEWHSTKHGGPVHYWRRIDRGQFSGLRVQAGIEFVQFQAECGLVREFGSLGKRRDPSGLKRTCKACRTALIEFHIQ